MGSAPADVSLATRIAAMCSNWADAVAALEGAAPEIRDGVRFLRVIGEAGKASADYPTAPLRRLVDRYQLTDIDANLLVLSCLPEHHEGLSALARALHPRHEPWVSAGLAGQLLASGQLDRRQLRRALVSGAAVRNGLFTLDGAGPVWDRSLRPADGLWDALCGTGLMPEPLEQFASEAPRAGLRSWLASDECGRALAALVSGERCVVVLTADNEETALARAAAMLTHGQIRGVAVRRNGPSGLSDPAERLGGMHAVIHDAVPVVVVSAAVPDPNAPSASTGIGVLENHPGPVLVCAPYNSAPHHRSDRTLIMLEAHKLNPLSRREMWDELVPELSSDAGLLAARHPIEPSLAAAAARDARTAGNGSGPDARALSNAVRARTRQMLPAAANLVRTQAGWDRLVLPADRMAQLRDAVDRLVHQDVVLGEWGFLEGRTGARGVRLLFAGPSGTGKTLSAEVLAHELGVDLLMVDLSQIMSKWIGETEKNLAGVFDSAERAQAVLFFDEADALFGERTEVRDAHDRYANLETAFLLSRLERFEGLAVLATNLRGHIDPAFTRRLQIIVEYSEPDAAQRRALWVTHLPKTAPLGASVDTSTLAELYPIVGALISNAAVAAGFMAAAEGSPIEQRHLVRCVQREYQKSGRAFPGAPFGILEEEQWQPLPT
jgi:hypothetical protein